MNKKQIESIHRLAWKLTPLPSGCENCWGDLHQGCTEECRKSDQEHTKKIELFEKEVTNLVTTAVNEALDNIYNYVESESGKSGRKEILEYISSHKVKKGEE